MANWLAISILLPFFIVVYGNAAFADEPQSFINADELPLVDEVLCGNLDDTHLFTEYPEGISKVENILNRPCRILQNSDGSKYFAYRMGRGKGLKAGEAYVLSIDFPEDQPRTMFVLNRGAETARGIGSGSAVGDVLFTYTNNNLESLDIPLSGKYQTCNMLFFLHDRFPDIKIPRGAGPRPFTPQDGFWVIIAQSGWKNAPLSAGAAISRIRLFHVPDPSLFDLKINFPPDDLPRRHIFWREEMSDGVVHSQKEEERGVINDIDWFEYRARLMKFLGVNTYCKDLLEFGHNQGWDASSGGGHNWYYEPKHNKRWENMLDMLGKYNFDVMPYYEYAGSDGYKGLGREKRCQTLFGGDAYTHVKWSEGLNADITDPDTLTDAKKLLDATIINHKDKVNFIGAWFRTRPSMIPVSFSDRCLKLFAEEANSGQNISRKQLKEDKALYSRYYEWWLEKRHDFFADLGNYLQSSIGDDAVILFTPHSSEPGPSLEGWIQRIVTDVPDRWSEILKDSQFKKFSATLYADVVGDDMHLKAATAPPKNFGDWEWHHSCPPADPQRYKNADGIIVTYPFNRAYTVSSQKAFDSFRCKSGLAIIRHYSLNEDVLEKRTGYFVSDVDRSGSYSMLGEARAMAYGDPHYIGYLAASAFNRCFPEYTRMFNAAFLALPALPSKILSSACIDPDIVVRAIETDRHGTYLAVVNVGLVRKNNVVISLPISGRLTNLVSGETISVTNDKLNIEFYPCELKALHIQ